MHYIIFFKMIINQIFEMSFYGLYILTIMFSDAFYGRETFLY